MTHDKLATQIQPRGMNVLIRRALTFLSVMTLGIAALLTPGSPAAAVTYCTSFGCDGTKVSDTECKSQAYAITGAQTTNSAGVKTAEADLWYSPTCHAMWGDYTSLSDEFLGNVYIEVESEYGGVNETKYEVGFAGKGNVVTTLVGWQRSVRLCSAGGTTVCTAWR